MIPVLLDWNGISEVTLAEVDLREKFLCLGEDQNGNQAASPFILLGEVVWHWVWLRLEGPLDSALSRCGGK